MASKPSASESGRSSGARDPGGEARQKGPTAPERAGSGGMEDDPVVESSSDPWAESDAGHPDESSSDALDQHPQPEGEAGQNPGA